MNRMMNRVALIGRLTKDPELFYTKQGIAYARICVAVNRGFRNSLGEQQADFIHCMIWRKSAETFRFPQLSLIFSPVVDARSE